MLVLRCAVIPPSGCQISRQSDIAFALYGSFCKCVKRRKIRRKKMKFLNLHISGTLEAISLKFGMCGTEVGGRCENCIFVLLVNIPTGVACRLPGPHDTLPCVLIHCIYS